MHKIYNLAVKVWVKGVPCREWLWKGCDFSIMNFRDMGPFVNLPYTHVNIGFYLSDPPGYHDHHHVEDLFTSQFLVETVNYWVNSALPCMHRIQVVLRKLSSRIPITYWMIKWRKYAKFCKFAGKRQHQLFSAASASTACLRYKSRDKHLLNRWFPGSYILKIKVTVEAFWSSINIRRSVLWEVQHPACLSRFRSEKHGFISLHVFWKLIHHA